MALAEQEIDRIDWGTLREASGPASAIPGALKRLLAATDPSASETAYWQLENHVVVQGTVYEAAAPTVSVLVAALADGRPRHVRIAVLDLLYQIPAGAPAPSEPPSLLKTCRDRAREGQSVLMREMEIGEHDAARDVLALLEPRA